MSETKHTPGPWVVIDYQGPYGRSVDVAQAVGAPYCRGSSDVAEVNTASQEEETIIANARLIAAAPDLLEALEMIRDADNDCKKDGLPPLPAAARARIDNAIQKARGEA